MGATLVADGATFRVWAPHARDRCTRWATSTTTAGTTPACSRATNWDIGADSFRACAIATATCSTWSVTAAKGRNAIRTRESSRRRFPANASSDVRTSPGTRAGSSHPPFRISSSISCMSARSSRRTCRPRAARFWTSRARFRIWPALGVTAIQLMPIQEFQTRVQPRIQRHRLLLTRDGLRRRRRRAAVICRGGQPTARRQGRHALPGRRPPGRDEPAEGARRSGAPSRARRHSRSRLQPCGR